MKAKLFLILATGFSSLCMADSSSIQRCRTIEDSMQRLKCYDAIPVAPDKPQAELPTKPTEQGRASPPGPSTVNSAAAKPADASALFGLESRTRPAAGPDSISSSIAGRFEGWVGNSRIRLANGQLWEIRDGSQAAYDLRDPKVRVFRGLSGSFFMEIEGISQTPRVRRIE